MGSTIESMDAPAPSAAVADATLEDQLVAFFGAHYGRLIRLAALVCYAGIPAEDAVQAAIEQAWRRRGSLHDPARLRAWLDRIVVREAIRLNRRPWWRREREAEGVQARLIRDPRADVGPDRVALKAAFASISIEQRAAIVLHLHAGYSVVETAELMGASVETTRSRLRLARARLRRELAEDST